MKQRGFFGTEYDDEDPAARAGHSAGVWTARVLFVAAIVAIVYFAKSLGQ